MHLRLKALAGDVPVEILVKPDPCERQPDRHDVSLSVGDSDSGTLEAHMDSWWCQTVARRGVTPALSDNADHCRAKETDDIAAVVQTLTIAAVLVVSRLGE